MGAGPSVSSPPDAPLPTLGTSEKEKQYEAVLSGKQDAVRKVFYRIDGVGKEGVLTQDKMVELVGAAKIGKADAEQLKAWYEGIEAKPEHGGLGELEFGYYLCEIAMISEDLGEGDNAAKLDAVLAKCTALLDKEAPKAEGGEEKKAEGGAKKLYAHELSQPSRSCLMFIKYAGLPFEHANVNIFAGEQKAPEYVAKFPSGQVPCLEDGDFYLEESAAMLQYLARAHDHAIEPKCPKQRAKVEKLYSRHGSASRRVTMECLVPVLFKGAAVDSVLGTLKEVLKGVNDALTTKFSAGEELSLYDFLLAAEVDQAAWFQADILADFPNVARFLKDFGEAVPAYADSQSKAKEIFDGLIAAKKEAPAEEKKE